MIIEAAWSYRYRPSVSVDMRRRRNGQPKAVLAIADRAQHRLHHRYFKLKEGYKKPHNVAVVAVVSPTAIVRSRNGGDNGIQRSA
jgi:hypothetical protein